MEESKKPKTENKKTELEKKLEELKNQNEEYLNNWKRERADFINYKNSENQRLDRARMIEKTKVLQDFLDIRDDLEKTNNSNDGIEVIIKKFNEILKRNGVEKIKTDGPFDPNIHEAVEMEPEGEKLVEVRAGYTMNGEVIRPARIKIIK